MIPAATAKYRLLAFLRILHGLLLFAPLDSNSVEATGSLTEGVDTGILAGTGAARDQGKASESGLSCQLTIAYVAVWHRHLK